MPTYSYRCTECGVAFDIQQAFTDDSLTVCPNCGGKLRKLYGSVGVTFNGSGFYRTDSRADSGPTANGAATSDGAAKSGGDSASSSGASGVSSTSAAGSSGSTPAAAAP